MATIKECTALNDDSRLFNSFPDFKRYPFENEVKHIQTEDDVLPMTLQFINGNFSHSLSGQILNIADLDGKKVVARVTKSCREDVQTAVAAAKSALKTFHQTPIHSRQHILSKLCDRLEEEMHTVESEQEKHEIITAIRVFRYYATWKGNETVHGHLNQSTQSSNITYSVHVPVGVVGVLLSMHSSYVHIALALGPALICGNSVVIKVSERGPLHALAFSKILSEIDVFPAGLVNFITGAALETGAELVRHHDVAKIVFAGSLRVANFAFESCQLCRPVKQTWMALNVKAPALVLGDADITRVVQCLKDSVFGSSAAPSTMTGECLVIDRVYASKDIVSELLDKLVDMVNNLPQCGNDSHVSRCNNQYHQTDFAQTQNYLRHHMNKGAQVVVGGAGISYHYNTHVSTSHMQPTVLVTGIDASVGAPGATSGQTNFHAELLKESALVDFQEVSAPLVHVVVCDNPVDMVVLANQQTQFLRQAYCAVFSDSFTCMSHYSHQLAAETIVFNDLGVSTESHVRDASALAFFTETKAVMWTHHTAAGTTEQGAYQQPCAVAAVHDDAKKVSPEAPTIATNLAPPTVPSSQKQTAVEKQADIASSQHEESTPMLPAEVHETNGGADTTQPVTNRYESHATISQGKEPSPIEAHTVTVNPICVSGSPLHRTDDTSVIDVLVSDYSAPCEQTGEVIPVPSSQKLQATNEEQDIVKGVESNQQDETHSKDQDIPAAVEDESSSPVHKMHRVGSPSFPQQMTSQNGQESPQHIQSAQQQPSSSSDADIQDVSGIHRNLVPLEEEPPTACDSPHQLTPEQEEAMRRGKHPELVEGEEREEQRVGEKVSTERGGEGGGAAVELVIEE